MKTLVGYARVSTQDQDLELQLEALKNCGKVFHGKQSGVSNQNEKKLAELVEYVRSGDTVVVTKLDRLGRSLKGILEVIDQVHAKGCYLKTLDGSIDTSNKSPFAKAMISLMGTFAQLERDLIVSRTSEGREAAMAKGVKFGRPAALSLKQVKEIKKRKAKGENISQLAKAYDVGRPTIYRALS